MPFAQADPVMLVVGPQSLVQAAVGLGLVLGTMVGGGSALGLLLLGRQMSAALDHLAAGLAETRKAIEGLNTAVAVLSARHDLWSREETP